MEASIQLPGAPASFALDVQWRPAEGGRLDISSSWYMHCSYVHGISIIPMLCSWHAALFLVQPQNPSQPNALDFHQQPFHVDIRVSFSHNPAGQAIM